MGGIVLMVLIFVVLFVIARVTSSADAVSVEACRTYGKSTNNDLRRDSSKWTVFFQYLQLSKDTALSTFSLRGIVVSGALVQTLLQLSVISISTVVPLLLALDAEKP